MKLNNMLIKGDCIEIMEEIPDKSVDMILCDMPYGTTQNKWDSVIPLEKIWGGYNRIIKDNGAICLFSQMPFTATLANSNERMFRYEWIWRKSKPTGHLNSKKMPLKAHENILVFYKNMPKYNPQGLIKKKIPTVRKGRDNGTNYGESSRDAIQEYENYPIDILAYGSESRTVHPTQKPVALLEYLIKTYTNEGEVVLDNCMGSGSTCVACVNTNRRFVGIELDENYFNVAKDRVLELTEDVEIYEMGFNPYQE